MGGGYIVQEEEEDEEQFFDTKEDISSMSDSYPSSPVNEDSNAGRNSFIGISDDPWYKVWIGKPDSIQERRSRFKKWMGLDPNCSPKQISVELGGEITVDSEVATDMGRLESGSGAVLRSSDSENGPAAMSCRSNGGASSSHDGPGEQFEYRIKNLDDGTVFVVDKLGRDGSLNRLREVGSDRMVSIDEFHRSLGPSPFVRHFMRRDDSASTSSGEAMKTPRKTGWLRRLRVAACIVDRQEEESNEMPSDSDQSARSRVHRVSVRSYRKRSKEFSAVYKGHDIKAHDGAILTMKFSPDGQYLASGGEDGIVRVWSVHNWERRDETDLPEEDSSCVYISVNSNAELAPMYTEHNKKSESKGMRRMSDSACVVIPSEVFQISGKPVHEFHGHTGDVLDLSWSSNKHLLSASLDKTVRLWQVGCDTCLKVFPHNNYVTCIQFNPVDENYFISGSIDGKVRIWEICCCHVVDWTDIRDIVTAVCYCPNGKGGVVGSMEGNCRFYDAIDNHLQLETQISLPGKKKSPCKRITGFQFSPSDPNRLMVTSADSQIRILDGVDVVCKYKGLRNAGSQISASFTSDGRHIISASEDSNIYVWSHNNHDGPAPNHVKTIWSSERIVSRNVSVAIPWPGLESRNPVSITSEVIASQFDVFRDPPEIPEPDLHLRGDSLGNRAPCLSSSGSFTLSQGFFSEGLPKGSATWPEEKLPSGLMIASPALCKSKYRLLKSSCQKPVTSHAWGQVIVTAGLDGRIRSFHNYGLPVHI